MCFITHTWDLIQEIIAQSHFTHVHCIENSCYRDRCKWSLKVSRDGDGDATLDPPTHRGVAGHRTTPLADHDHAHLTQVPVACMRWAVTDDDQEFYRIEIIRAVGGRNFAWIHAPRPTRDGAGLEMGSGSWPWSLQWAGQACIKVLISTHWLRPPCRMPRESFIKLSSSTGAECVNCEPADRCKSSRWFATL